MKGFYGHIKYKAVVVLDDAENLKNSNEEFEIPITIIKSYDLNTDPDTKLCVIFSPFLLFITGSILFKFINI